MSLLNIACTLPCQCRVLYQQGSCKMTGMIYHPNNVTSRSTWPEQSSLSAWVCLCVCGSIWCCLPYLDSESYSVGDERGGTWRWMNWTSPMCKQMCFSVQWLPCQNIHSKNKLNNPNVTAPREPHPTQLLPCITLKEGEWRTFQFVLKERKTWRHYERST